MGRVYVRTFPSTVGDRTLSMEGPGISPSPRNTPAFERDGFRESLLLPYVGS